MSRIAANGWRPWLAHPLPWLLLLAAGLRGLAVAQPGFDHPDAIYQYLEPARRLLTGDGAITWEWRVGMRSWLLPALLAAPIALGEAVHANGVTAARAAAALASLGIVWAAWRLGRRDTVTTGTIAGLVAATWFELVHVGAQTLAEPLATAAFLPAAVLITAPWRSWPHHAAAGALLAFAVLLRPHYAPAAATLVMVAWRTRERPAAWLALAAGGLALATVSAGIDVASGAMPFAWIAENIRQNIVEHVAARYGESPPLGYVAWWLGWWRWWTVPLLVGVRFGWRQAPAPCAAALVTLAVHSLIGHKEYRFMFLATAILVVVSALGWGAIVAQVRQRCGDGVARSIGVVTAAGWALASLVLASGPLARERQMEGRAGTRLFTAIRSDPAACGVGIVYGASFADVPGTIGLPRGMAIDLFWPTDPLVGTHRLWRSVAAAGAGFNRIVSATPDPLPGDTTRTATAPPGYARLRCEPTAGGYALCLYGRPGLCAAGKRTPFALNSALARAGF